MATNAAGTIKRSGSLRFDTGRLRRNIQKHINRTKERMLNNLEKGEKTEDEFIKKSEAILIKKQATTVKLQTELKRHLKALKNVSASSRSLHETMLEAYEDNWAGRKEFADALVTLDSCWLHYFNTLCTVLEQVGSHVDEFVNVKEKLEKRKRKLVDYNLAKRNLHQSLTSKKKDESKLKKAKRELEFVEAAYCELNAELRKELPGFYDSHVHFCCENWSYLLENEKKMYEDVCKTVQTFMSSLHQLRLGYQKSEYQLSGVELSYSEISRSSISLGFESTYVNGDVYESLNDLRPRYLSDSARPPSKEGFGIQRHASAAQSHFPKGHRSTRSQSMDNVANLDDSGEYGSIEFPPAGGHAATLGAACRLRDVSARREKWEAEESVYNADHHIYAEPDLAKKERAAQPEEEVYNDVCVPSTPSSSLSSRHHSFARSTTSSSPRPDKARRADNLPMMIVIHPYVGQDDDELDLSVNDLVQVLPWENESLMEDGWLFGMKLPDGRKGLFPENHTNVFGTSEKNAR